MNYHLYHDESKQNGFWHGMLLVPEDSRSLLVNVLEKIRKNTGYDYPLGIKNVDSTKGPIFLCAQSWILLAIGFMRTRIGREPYQVHYGKIEKGRLNYDILKENLGLKFILFREKHDHKHMEYLNTYAEKVETTFRIGLKGGLQFLSSDETPIRIVKMHFDGYEHYRRKIDKERIVGRLHGLKSSCSIKTSTDLIDDRTSNHKRHEAQPYNDCQILQLTDLLIGSFRTLLGECTHDAHRTLAHAARLPLQAFTRGPTGYKNSRWNGSFCMSQCEVINGELQFSTIDCGKKEKSTQSEMDL